MKKILYLLFLIPFTSFSQDESPTLRRDKIIITNLICQQLPELYKQNKYSEVINLMTDDFIMINYVKGEEVIIMGKTELKNYYAGDGFRNLNPIYKIKTLRILENKAFVSGDYIYPNESVVKPIVFLMTLTKQPNTAWLVSQEINAIN